MNIELLKMIILICSTTSVEDNSSSWTEYKNLQVHQKECREYFYSCNPVGASGLIKCDRKRKIK